MTQRHTQNHAAHRSINRRYKTSDATNAEHRTLGVASPSANPALDMVRNLKTCNCNKTQRPHTTHHTLPLHNVLKKLRRQILDNMSKVDIFDKEKHQTRAHTHGHIARERFRKSNEVVKMTPTTHAYTHAAATNCGLAVPCERPQ